MITTGPQPASEPRLRGEPYPGRGPSRRAAATATASAGWRHVLWPVLCLVALTLRAAEVIPPAPPNHFNDFAGVISPAVAQRLNAELAGFERDTSSQLIVAIYPHMQSDSSIEDYTVRVFQAWQVGRKGRNNGAVLFVFTQDHRLRIATGYGLEGVLPDALCRRIIANEITPRLRGGNFDAGLTAGVQALMAAAKGEYRGTGRTVRDEQGGPIRGATSPGIFGGIIFLIVMALILRAVFGSRRSLLYGGAGRRGVWINPGGWGGGNWGGGGGGWSGGGGGGSFSGGGGSTGGGGASGSW